MQFRGLRLHNPAYKYTLSRGCYSHFFRGELDSFFTCAEIGVVLLDIVESTMKNFKLMELKNNFLSLQTEFKQLLQKIYKLFSTSKIFKINHKKVSQIKY